MQVKAQRNLAVLYLRIAVFISLAGFFLQQQLYRVTLGSFLYLSYPISAEAAQLVEVFSSLFLLTLIALVTIYPHRIIYLLFSLWTFLWALATFLKGGQFASDWALLAHAARYLSPLAVFLALVRPQSSTGPWLLKLGLALTFALHGLECLALHPQFKDFLFAALNPLLADPLSEQSASLILYLIGTQDILLALLILITERRSVIYYMAFWGGLTALYRVYYSPTHGLALAMIRSLHFFGPLILCHLNKKKLSTQFERQSPHEYPSESSHHQTMVTQRPK